MLFEQLQAAFRDRGSKTMAERSINPSNKADSDAVILDRVQELTWALLDEQITEDEVALLDNLLLSDDKARSTYVRCVQMHTELVGHFAAQREKAGTATAAKSPVLGFLNAGMLPAELQLPPAEDLRT
jgi:hypothetical protein